MIAKELRALLPPWCAAAAAMLLAKAIGRDVAALVPPLFFLGTAGIAAWPIGQEYSFRTLPSLLTLPVPRWRIWVAKLAAPAPLLAALSAVALWTVPARPDVPFGAAAYFLPGLAALFIAPWLTMASRSAVAGVVFTNSIGAITLVLGAWLGLKRYGYTADVDRFQWRFLFWTMAALTAIAAMDGFRMFLRLEASEGRATHVELGASRSAAGSAPTRQHPAWLLVKKDVHLLQLSWIFAAMFAAGYITVVVTQRDRINVAAAVTLVIVIHAFVQSLLNGALAGAEERAFGTHDAQLLLPMSTGRQWAIKAATAIVHALLLSIALPWLLVTLLPPGALDAVTRRGPLQPSLVAIVVSLTTVALYISSVSTSGLRALMASVPAVLLLLTFLQRSSWYIEAAIYRTEWGRQPAWIHLPRRAGEGLGLAFVVGLCVWGLSRALKHYRWNDRNWTRLTADAAWLAIALIAYSAITAVLHI